MHELGDGFCRWSLISEIPFTGSIREEELPQDSVIRHAQGVSDGVFLPVAILRITDNSH